MSMSRIVSAFIATIPGPVSKVISSYRHPALTPEQRLVTGDWVGEQLLLALQSVGQPAEWYPLLWEAHAMYSHVVAAVSFQLPKLFGQMEVEHHCGFATVPWWKNANDVRQYMATAVDRAAESVSDDLALVVQEMSLDPRIIAERWGAVATDYANFLGSAGPMSTASYHQIYRPAVVRLLGGEWVPTQAPVPALSIGALNCRMLERWGEEAFMAAIAKLCPNGEKNLFMGGDLDDRTRIQYVGYSPKGSWLRVSVDPVTGKTKGRPKPIAWQEILGMVEASQLLPIGWSPILTVLTTPGVLHHGADWGMADTARNCGFEIQPSLAQPHDSWPFLVIEHEGHRVAPSLNELFLLFGERNLFVIRAIEESIKTGVSTVVDLKTVIKAVTHCD